jgi:PTS system nitrogen regulatory IIA component
MSSVVGTLIRQELIFPELPAADRAGVLHDLARRTAAAGLVGLADADRLFRALWEREQLGSTGIGQGVAIPHCKLRGLPHGIVALGLARPGVAFDAPDGLPVSVFFLVLSPDESPAEHLLILAKVSRWLREDGRVAALLSLTDRDAIFDYLRESL